MPTGTCARTVPSGRSRTWTARELTFSAPGSFTHLLVQTIAREVGVKPKYVATGSMTATRHPAHVGPGRHRLGRLPGQPRPAPSGEARMIGTGDVSPLLQGMTMRVTAGNADWLAKNRDVAVRFMRALWKGQQYNFSGPESGRAIRPALEARRSTTPSARASSSSSRIRRSTRSASSTICSRWRRSTASSRSRCRPSRRPALSRSSTIRSRVDLAFGCDDNLLGLDLTGGMK